MDGKHPGLVKIIGSSDVRDCVCLLWKIWYSRTSHPTLQGQKKSSQHFWGIIHRIWFKEPSLGGMNHTLDVKDGLANSQRAGNFDHFN